MSRVSRNDLLYEGCYAHIISRSIRKLKIFQKSDDFVKFKDLLLIAKRKAGFKIFHYCIMQTHFHLAIQMGDVEQFSLAIRDLKRSYVYWFHEQYRLSGPIWRERFKSLLVENEDYLYTCGLYIENNPLKAGLVSKSQDWEHSSAKYYLEGNPDDLVDVYNKRVKIIEDQGLGEDVFESGSVIGSSFFRFQFLESRKANRPVPSE